MYDYVKGRLEELNPAQAVVEAGGFGYRILISLQTYSALESKVGTEVKVYLYHYLREDDEGFFGFSTKDERSLFELLISVSGIGPSTARMVLSSMTSDELSAAIVAEDINKIKSIKGIGLKSAQRLVLELKDKIVKGGGKDASFIGAQGNPNREEAATALVLLGFPKAAVEKTLDKLVKDNKDASLEDLIKQALKML
ncbi:MAG: Holliday junction branch migration protein RuvA [Bacteroidales bacterium]|nr:Holliday junction branch migration protein RuvA [Bacteroidales bacterium]MBO7487454.1 Holliday junction branch migration protein RuvA [Bacteroidales bacterium]